MILWSKVSAHLCVFLGYQFSPFLNSFYFTHLFSQGRRWREGGENQRWQEQTEAQAASHTQIWRTRSSWVSLLEENHSLSAEASRKIWRVDVFTVLLWEHTSSGSVRVHRPSLGIHQGTTIQSCKYSHPQYLQACLQDPHPHGHWSLLYDMVQHVLVTCAHSPVDFKAPLGYLWFLTQRKAYGKVLYCIVRVRKCLYMFNTEAIFSQIFSVHDWLNSWIHMNDWLYVLSGHFSVFIFYSECLWSTARCEAHNPCRYSHHWRPSGLGTQHSAPSVFPPRLTLGQPGHSEALSLIKAS